jgi:hypothetical protein
MSIDAIGKLLQSNQHLFVDARVYLRKNYGWDENDARITVFNKCSNVCSSVLLGYVFIDKYLSNKEWWKLYSTLPIDSKEIQRAGNEFEMFLRVSLIQSTLYAVESSFRIYVVFLDSKACSNGLGEFKNIYEWLLKRTSLQSYSALLDIFRNIRNSMHNNGLFLPISGKDSTIKYKGRSFEFKYGLPNDFVSTILILELISDVRELLLAIVQSEDMKEHRHISEIS